MQSTSRNGYLALCALVCASVLLIATGWTDGDWQLVSYRYSEWHRSVETWEYNPYFIVNWWVAWQFNLARIGVGCVILGFILSELRWRLHVEKGTKTS